MLSLYIGCKTWSLTLRKERGLRVFENMVVRRIFGPKRDVLTGEWRKLRNEGINHLFSSPNIIWVIKSRRMKWAVHLACMRERKFAYRILIGKPEEKSHSEDPGVDGRIILRWILRKWAGALLDLSSSG